MVGRRGRTVAGGLGVWGGDWWVLDTNGVSGKGDCLVFLPVYYIEAISNSPPLYKTRTDYSYKSTLT